MFKWHLHTDYFLKIDFKFKLSFYEYKRKVVEFEIFYCFAFSFYIYFLKNKLILLRLVWNLARSTKVFKLSSNYQKHLSVCERGLGQLSPMFCL